VTIDQRTLETLEFRKILARLAEHTSFSASRALALQLRPEDDLAAVTRAQQATTAARHLFDNHPEISIGGARDVRPAVQLALRGGMLEPTVLLEVAGTLGAMRQLRTALLKLSPEVYGPLLDLAVVLPDLPDIEAAIDRSIDSGGEVLDSASPALARIRAEIRVAHSRLMERLQSIISSSQYAGALQEPIITVREGRYVVPIKAAGRRTLRGIVHDQSNSGATLFVEPLQTVDLNNTWRELQIAEQQEIVRILQALSALIAQDGEHIRGGVDALAEIDLLFAKGRYSAGLNCVEPLIGTSAPTPEGTAANVPDAPLRLIQARHPLLDQTTVVPTNLWLGSTMRVLLITGPNTGGKTVALKTAGLLALMAQSGLHIPAAFGSRLPVFTGIFADIGDEQSIEQSLSTFSSHMSHIIAILDELSTMRLGPRALVLLDELGAGTDPTEGAALARAIVERLLELECLVIATTHYAELKAYAYNTPGVENGSVTFDQETLRPTYELEIGLPGRSNALAIATRLGLPGELVDRARSFLSAETEQVEDLLAAIARERNSVETERVRAEELREDAEKVRNQLQHELDELQRERQARVESFERELEEELRGARQELRRLRDDTRSASLTREWMQQAEERLRSTGEQVEASRSRRAAIPAPVQPVRTLQPGDRVHVASVKLDGEVLAVDEESGEVDVQVGGFRMRVDARELRRPKGGGPVALPARAVAPPPPSRDVSMQLDLRGMRAHEIPELLDRYINDAYLANLNEVRIVHGKGTGTLRKIVRDGLAAHPLVKSFAPGVDGEGGEGVTTAKLERR
jgi:DNA mismatch repair protein MutS2